MQQEEKQSPRIISSRRYWLLASALASVSWSLSAPAQNPSSEPVTTQLAPPPPVPTLPTVSHPTTAEASQPPLAPTLPSVPPPPANSGASSSRPAPSTGPAASLPLAVPTHPATAQSTTPTTDRVLSDTSNLSLTQPTTGQTNSGEQAQERIHDVVVSADLDRSRDQIAPALGADTYTIGPNQIQNIPGGESAPFQQELLRAPGVVEDSFGQLHVRGEHNNLTYRVNGVLLPEGLNGFGQELDTRIISSVTLIDGSLPAQFGFRTAGIVDVVTKSGATLNNNELSLYGGSFNTIEPSLQLGGTDKKLDYFAVMSYKYDDIGIENPTSSYNAIHDQTQQEKLFAYLAYRLDDTSRLSLLLNASNADFQIPNVPGAQPAFKLGNIGTVQSADLNENQNEQDYYSVLSYQHSTDEVSFQVSGYTRYGQINYNGDPVRDLIFQGVTGHVFNSFLTNGIQADMSYVLDDHHTIRAGLLADYTSEQLFTNTSVFPTDTSGAQTSTAALGIPDDS